MAERDDLPPGRWWMTQAERRLNDLHTSLEGAWRELREEIKRGDSRQFVLNHLDERMKEIRKQIEDVRECIRDDLLTKEDFEPYRKGIILVLSTIVLAVIGALMRLVVVSH